MWSMGADRATRPKSAEPWGRAPRGRLFIASVIAAIAVAVLYLPYNDQADAPANRDLSNGFIYFTVDENPSSVPIPGPYSLYSIAADGSVLTRIPLAMPRGLSADIATSPDGKALAFSNLSRFAPRNIFTVGLDGSGFRQISFAAATSGVSSSLPQDVNPTWSPNGEWIAFSRLECCERGKKFGHYALHVVNADGSGLRALTDGLLTVMNPEWSPDGSTIAYAGSTATLPLQIGIMNSDGTGARVLTKGGLNSDPVWSPDGEHLAYVSGTRTHSEIRVIAKDGSGDRAAFRCEEGCGSIEWSPDGTLIAFIFTEGPSRDAESGLGLVAPDGSGFREVDTQGLQPADLSWAVGE